ncbi:unnamed protein product [Mucor hiemalis]
MAPTSTPPKYIQQLIESNEKLFIELTEIRKEIKEIKEIKDIIASTTHPANSSLLIPHYSNNICKYPVPHRRSSPKTNILTLLKEVFPSEEQREKIEDKYRSMANSALKACKAFILRKNNEGTPWKEIASLDKLQLVKHTADLIVSVSDEMTFVYDCEKLWPAAFLVKSCWTNKAKNYNEKMSKVM